MMRTISPLRYYTSKYTLPGVVHRRDLFAHKKTVDVVFRRSICDIIFISAPSAWAGFRASDDALKRGEHIVAHIFNALGFGCAVITFYGLTEEC